MAVYTYKATDSRSADFSGTIAADTPRQARDLLRGRGLIVKDLATAGAEPQRPGGHSSSGDAGDAARVTGPRRPTALRPFARRGTGYGARRHQATTFVRELATLLGVGVPLLEALGIIARQHKGRFRESVLLLRERVASGSALAAAMREQPHVFDDLCANIAEVGEDAGTLDASLERLAEFRERSEQLRGRVGTALIYPAIVLSTAAVAGGFLMTFVVPRILEPLIEQGQPLPLPTRVVKGLSDCLLAWGWLLLVAAAGAAAGWTALLRSSRGRIWWHRALLRVPLVGDLVRKQAIVRVAVVVGTLLKSGIVFLRALEIARRTTGNLVLRDALGRCGLAVAAGGDIADALEQTGAFPPMVVQVFALGQQSGRLEEMLDRLAANYDREVSAAAQRLAAVLEPALIIVLAFVVLFIVLATVLPILEAGNAIG